jgi:FixJ family two-component response regulator
LTNEAAAKVPLISIVDDDISVRVAMMNLIRSLGFAARSFESADSYLGSPERRETACIVSDVQMPGTNGLEMQRRLAAQNDQTPIIFITAFPEANLERRARDAGAVCFLTKPFNSSALIGCIERALKGRQHQVCC